MGRTNDGTRFSRMALFAGVVAALVVLALLTPFTCSSNSATGNWTCSNALGLTLPGFSGGSLPSDPSYAVPLILGVASGVVVFFLVLRRSNAT